MYPPNFQYKRANSVAEAVSMLSELDGARLIAGGHSLIPMMNLRLASPPVLIDIGRIAEMKGISTADGAVQIGTLTTHAAIAASGEVPGALSEAAGMIGDPQVRNRGTIGGNIAHADPGSDLPTVLTALGATFHITGPGGDRTIAASEFFTGLLETALMAGEIITAVRVPAEAPGTGSAYAKLPHPASRYAVVGAAAVVTAQGARCISASVAVGGVTPHAVRAPSVEAALTGKDLNDGTIAAASEAVSADLGGEIMEDLFAGADYRKAMAAVYVRRALTAAAGRA